MGPVPEPPDLDPALAQAAQDDYARSLDEVAGLDGAGQNYLDRVDELDDPLSDGLDCGGI